MLKSLNGKPCRECDREEQIAGLCVYHYWQSKRTPVKASKKAPAKIKSDTAFYTECWQSLPHACKECGKPFDQPMRWMFAHILPKSVYPTLRHNPQNIVLLCFDHHRQLDQGRASEMRIAPWIAERREELKNQV